MEQDRLTNILLIILFACSLFIIYRQINQVELKESKITVLEEKVESIYKLNEILERKLDSISKVKAKVKERIVTIQQNKDEKIRTYDNLDTSERIKFFASWINEELSTSNRTE